MGSNDIHLRPRPRQTSPWESNRHPRARKTGCRNGKAPGGLLLFREFTVVSEEGDFWRKHKLWIGNMVRQREVTDERGYRRWVVVPLEHEHEFSSEGRCMWYCCEEGNHVES